MALDNGYIKLHRKLLKWEWYDDLVTKAVFFHLLLTVNIKDDEWHGVKILRGSRIASYQKLADELHITFQQACTAISHLENTGEITRSKSGKITVFTVKNYDKYQTPTSKSQGEQQATNKNFNKLPTNCQQQNKKNKEEIRNKEGGAAPDAQADNVDILKGRCF